MSFIQPYDVGKSKTKHIFYYLKELLKTLDDDI